ncbi:MAG TPA: STAS domain-containing protein [Rectinema sp.]|nr:STAS domain-containing protein [Rectinema sp.]HRR39012.1 STAS domain-containing protein [Rectinema sp.]HRT38984.1 STAS domain-containing protein [Rectinema sp.]
MPSGLLSRIQKISQPGSDALISSQISTDFPGCIVAHFVGAVTEANLDIVAQSFDSILSEGIRYLVVDFSTIEDIGPAGMGLMLALRQKLRDRHGDLVLCGMRPCMERMQRILGLEGYFTTAADAQSALTGLKFAINGIYPLSVQCPACNSLIDIEKPGRGRCQTCEAVITAFPDGTITLG